MPAQEWQRGRGGRFTLSIPHTERYYRERNLRAPLSQGVALPTAPENLSHLQASSPSFQ